MAMKLIIDGYNFLWQYASARSVATSNFEKGREALLKWLTEQPRLQMFDITVVFDAYKTDALHHSQQKIQGIDVVYTAGGQTADQLIREMASQYTVGAIVVSSDREVARHAEKKGCGVLGSGEFRAAVERPEDFQIDPSRKMPKGKRKALAKFI
jgi:hypothetical protein